MLNMKKPIALYNMKDVLCVFAMYGMAMILGLGIGYILSIIQPIDSTDKSKYVRSGVRVITDYGTGKEYLETPEGFLTPRLPAPVKIDKNIQCFAPVIDFNSFPHEKLTMPANAKNDDNLVNETSPCWYSPD